MANFWDDISKGVRDAASYTVNKTEELTGTARLKLAIHSEKNKLEKCFTKIGKLYYDYHKTGADKADELAPC